MPDTLQELKECSCKELVHDPYWDPVEAEAWCEVELMKELNEIAPVSAIVMGDSSRVFQRQILWNAKLSSIQPAASNSYLKQNELATK